MKMPIFDKIALTRKAQALGFNRDTYEKMSRLTEILQYFNATQDLGANLALKGGTAINLTVFNLPRLSVDIDLDFSENLSREETKEYRDRISEVLGRYMSAESYALRDKSKHTHALDSFVYSYSNSAGNLDNIKIEINYGLRSHILPTVLTTVSVPDAFSEFEVRTLSPVEIFASKIVALSGRAAARDLYDLNNIAYFGLFDERQLTLLRKSAVFYQAVAGDTKSQGFNFAKAFAEITERKIRTDLFPMIRNTERFDFPAAKQRVAEFLAENLTLTEPEKKFLKEFSQGHYNPELLFDDESILERIKTHPMAAWRIQRTQSERDENKR
jgi:predicted nucleotidyltransferase component of viral defense system